PRLPRRHQGIDPARHRDHQAGAAARHPRVLLPDAVARLRGSQGALSEGGLDGPRHEQVRPQPPRVASPQDDGPRMGGGLSGRVAFYSRYVVETVTKFWGYWTTYRRCKAILDEVMAAPDRLTYSDLAIAPPQSDEFQTLDLYHATRGGEEAIARMHRDEAIRAGAQKQAAARALS